MHNLLKFQDAIALTLLRYAMCNLIQSWFMGSWTWLHHQKYSHQSCLPDLQRILHWLFCIPQAWILHVMNSKYGHDTSPVSWIASACSLFWLHVWSLTDIWWDLWLPIYDIHRPFCWCEQMFSPQWHQSRINQTEPFHLSPLSQCSQTRYSAISPFI